MLSLIRELPWPSIIKVFALGIACKTLYIFYSESSEKQDDTNDHVKHQSFEPIPPSEPDLPIQESQEELNTQMKLVYQELIKILPQLENIYHKLESIHTKLGDTKPIHTPEFIIDSNHVNLINENVLIEKILFEQSQFIEEKHDLQIIEPESYLKKPIESDLPKEIESAVKEEKVLDSEVEEEKVLESPVKEEKVLESEVNKEEKVLDSEVNKEVEEKEINKESQEKETDLQVEFKLSCETHTNEIEKTDTLDTPKSVNEKTCSFILRSGLRKGQLCNSKVKGKTQLYCGIHR